MDNRVLTPAEVLALPEGAKVWVETTKESHRTTGAYVWYKYLSALIYQEDDDEFILFPPVNMFVAFRVWSLPQPPTDEELAAWPWEEQRNARMGCRSGAAKPILSICDKGGCHMTDRDEAIRARCEQATPGEWFVNEENFEPYGVELRIYDTNGWAKGLDPIAALDLFCGQPDNAAFIAHAREDIPYLLDRVERLTAELAAMTAERDAALQHNRRVSSLPNCNDCRDAKSCEHVAPWGELVRFNCPLWRGPREDEPNDTKEANHADE